MTSRSLYRNTWGIGIVRGDDRAERLAAAMASEYHMAPSAVYVRADGSILIHSDGWLGDYSNLREVACQAAYEADQAGADSEESDGIFARFSGVWDGWESYHEFTYRDGRRIGVHEGRPEPLDGAS